MDTSFFPRKQREWFCYPPCSLLRKTTTLIQDVVHESVFHGVLDDVTFRDPIPSKVIL